jgi:hypothetical protein
LVQAGCLCLSASDEGLLSGGLGAAISCLSYLARASRGRAGHRGWSKTASGKPLGTSRALRFLPTRKIGRHQSASPACAPIRRRREVKGTPEASTGTVREPCPETPCGRGSWRESSAVQSVGLVNPVCRCLIGVACLVLERVVLRWLRGGAWARMRTVEQTAWGTGSPALRGEGGLGRTPVL